jgi:hypothetical protein
MTFNVSKGIAVATIAFSLTTMFSNQGSVLFNLQGVQHLLNLTVIFMIYSIVLSTIVVKYTDRFMKAENIADLKKAHKQ